MDKFKSFVLKVFTIPLWLLLMLCLLSAVSLVCIFTYGYEESVYAYILYPLSAYTLTALCFYCANCLPSLVKRIKSSVLFSKLAFDDIEKNRNSLYLSVIVNLVYICTNTFSAFFFKTAWFGIFAVYYTILTIMRVLLAKFIHNKGLNKDKIGEFKTARLCSIIMLSINLALSAAVLMMMYQGRGFEHHGVLIYVIALYTFYSIISAVIDVVKYNKLKNPIVSTSTMIKFTDALISMLLLETSMLAQFGAGNTTEFKRLTISLTGGGIAVVITFMAVYMLVQTNRQLKRLDR